MKQGCIWTHEETLPQHKRFVLCNISGFPSQSISCPAQSSTTLEMTTLPATPTAPTTPEKVRHWPNDGAALSSHHCGTVAALGCEEPGKYIGEPFYRIKLEYKAKTVAEVPTRPASPQNNSQWPNNGILLSHQCSYKDLARLFL